MRARATAGVLLLAAALAALPLPLAGEVDNSTRWIEMLSWHPRAYLFHNFLTHEECDHIIKISSPRLSRSSVVNPDGSVSDDPIRTSHGTFLSRAHDEVVYAIDSKVAEWTHLPLAHQEDMQVLRYMNNQSYEAHWDDLDQDENPQGLGGGSVRVATVLMFLSNVEEGGETAFPHSRWLDKEVQTAGNTYSKCAENGVAAKPRKGSAVMFWDAKIGSVRQDKWAMHAGCAVLKGTKWSATKWIHAANFGFEYPARPRLTKEASEREAEALEAQRQQQQKVQQEPVGPACTDDDERCPRWSKEGECSHNQAYMEEACRKSCGVCCLEGDVLCERRLKRFSRPH